MEGVAALTEQVAAVEARITACAKGGDFEALQAATLDQARLAAALEGKEGRWRALADRA